MHEEIKNRWIENLESGEYPKGMGSLRNMDNTYCCLGVLTDMYIREHDDLVWMGSCTDTTDGTPVADTPDTLIPTKVREWAGIDRGEYHIHDFSGVSLASLNDHSDTFEPVIERIKEL